MKIFVLLFCCALAFVVEGQENVNPVVETKNGAVKGSILKTRLGKDIYSFRGVRYADAPTGRNRFKQSTPAKPHTGIFDATQEGPSCPQFVNDGRLISEDCLRLNIYTTKLPQHQTNCTESSLNTSSNEPLKDVVVFIHPGAFFMYSGTTFDFGPRNLLDRDIVLVTINYRLASLGFLSTGDSFAPGNAGLKDQVQALRWVQQNIRNFGGNSDSVTLLGYSAGSWSISLHIVSPMSRGLFHRAIAMSGSATFPEPLPTHQQNVAEIQAKVLNCSTKTNAEMFECLYTKSTEDFANSIPKVFEATGFPSVIWTPVIEQEYYGNEKNEEPFLTSQLFDLIRSRAANFVPFITGVTRDEFRGAIIPAEELAQSGNNSIYDDLNNNWYERAPKALVYQSNSSRSHYISREFRKFYLNDEPVGVGHYQGLANLYADALNIQVHRFGRLMMDYSSQPVYNYFFIYPGCQSYWKWSNGTNFGVGHHDELLLLFKFGKFPRVCDKDVETLEHLTGIVESFAKTGRPIPIDWEPSTKDNPKYLKIDRELSMESGIIHEERMKKWDELFPLPSIKITN